MYNCQSALQEEAQYSEILHTMSMTSLHNINVSSCLQVREILGCPGVRALLQAHDVVAHEVYGEDALRVTPPSSTVNLVNVSGDEVEGPNGECPPVRGNQVIKLQSVRNQQLIIYMTCFPKTSCYFLQYTVSPHAVKLLLMAY